MPTTPSPVALTTYHVLKETSDNATFQLVAPNIAARNGNEAIKTFANDGPERTGGILEGVYVAVPARSWKPIKVAVQTKTTIRLG